MSSLKWLRVSLTVLMVLALFCGSALAGRPPKEPKNLDYSVISETSIELTWESGGGEDGFIVGYLEDVLPDPKCANVTPDDVGPATSYVVTDLTPGATYGFRVCAYNSSKTSDGATLLVTLGDDPPPPPSPTYEITWLDASYVTAINSHGHVVGVNGSAPFLYTPEDGVVDLNTLLPLGSGWVLSMAYDINDYGQIVGKGFNGGTVQRAYRAVLNEDNTEIVQIDEIGPIPFDDDDNSARAINDFGEVCGRMKWYGPPITRIAWYYNPGNPVTNISPLLGGMNLYATTINNPTVNHPAQILGIDEDSNGTLLFRASPGDTLETAKFFHSPAGEEYPIWGNDMNDDGWFVGRTTLEAVQINKNKVRLRVGAYRCDGVNFVDLGAGSGSEAYGINNHGDVVGTGISYGCGFVYLEGSGLVNLDDAVTGDLGLWFDAETIIDPQRINDSGQIAGRAYIGLVGASQAFLLTPVP
jgi:hypothetical protein